ncbi:MAG: hypothetical protein KDC84_16220, partial [Crocinitomicaceae bacterium]|nr:hypothetical protein [Crocinitomicaceae bacterium]
DGADYYKLEVVSPSFASISEFPLDSNITNTEFYYTLDPGVYEYRIRAINSAFESQYSEIRSFVIDSTSDLSSLTLLLTSPSDGYYTNSTSPTFVWQDLYPADVYELEIRQGTSWFTATQVETGNSFSSFYTLSTSLTEGNYLWQVTASNTLPSSTSSTQRALYIDLTNPGVPSLNSPTDLSSFADTVNFSWNMGSDNGGTVNSPRFDSLYIFSDSLNPFSSEITRIYSASQSATYIFQSTSSPYFYWRVRTLDEAGNQGNFSTIRRVIIQ